MLDKALLKRPIRTDLCDKPSSDHPAAPSHAPDPRNIS